MELTKPIKLLICSNSNEFLAEVKSDLLSNYLVQYAHTTDMIEFLLEEWEPHICLIEAAQNCGKTIRSIRSKRPFFKLIIFALCQKDDPNFYLKEEACFKHGADDFLEVPSNDGRSLIARLNSNLKKSKAFLSNLAVGQFDPGGFQDEEIVYGNLVLLPREHLVKCDGTSVAVSPTHFKLLFALMTHPDQLLSRLWLQQNVWGDSTISLRSIDAQISKLKKLIPYLDSRLINVYGKGYILTQEKQQAA